MHFFGTKLGAWSLYFFSIGRNLEDATIIDDLLDTKKFPQRPNYELAPENNLILYDCLYTTLQFTPEYEQSYRLYVHFRDIILEKTLEMVLYTSVINYLGTFEMMVGLPQSNVLNEEKDLQNCKKMRYFERFVEDDIQKTSMKTSHKKIKERPVSKSFEENVESLKGKKKELYLKKLKTKEENIDDLE